jgi:hypothetical protein
MPASSKRAVSDGEEFDGDTPREPEPIAKIFFTAPPNLSSLENVLQTLGFVLQFLILVWEPFGDVKNVWATRNLK